MRLSLGKEKRLQCRKWIKILFAKGRSYRSGPIQCYYLPWDGIAHHQILIAVPKKRLKKAVQRNKIKRRMREAYRQAQATMTPTLLGTKLLLGYVYLSDQPDLERYCVIAKAINHTIAHIKKVFCKKKAHLFLSEQH